MGSAACCAQTFRARGGHTIGLAEYGDPGGQPVVYFHGWPSSRLEPRFLHPLAQELGVRLLALDRPGYGLSTFRPGVRLQEWAREVVDFCEHLGVSRFRVLGVSGGAPHALACAAHFPGRVERAALVGGLGPLDRPGTELGMSRFRRISCRAIRRTPRLCWPITHFSLHRIRTQSAEALRSFAKTLPPADQAALADPTLFTGLVSAFAEGLRTGVQGAMRDLRTYFQPWDFHPAELSVPTTFYHGAVDSIVPAGMSQRLAEIIPGAELVLAPEDGHYSLPLRQSRLILQSLAG